MPVIPFKLNPGDTIGIVSPSTPVTSDMDEQFKVGVAFLENLGFKIVFGAHLFSASWGYTASPQEKAEDINAMFGDDRIQAIMCSQGGATANACLPYLDWDCIRQNPKIFLGISDITVLLNAILHKSGLVTFHGNDLLWGFGRNPGTYDRHEFVTRLVQGETGAVEPSGQRRTIRGGAAQGRLLGGNLPCLLKLAGTAYWPDFNASIMFVEAIGLNPEGCDYQFQQLKHIGVFDQIKGVIIGHIDSWQNKEQPSLQMEDILARITSNYDFPILKTEDFGHNCPNTVLPVGGMVGMDADNQTIEILEPPVQQR